MSGAIQWQTSHAPTTRRRCRSGFASSSQARGLKESLPAQTLSLSAVPSRTGCIVRRAAPPVRVEQGTREERGLPLTPTASRPRPPAARLLLALPAEQAPEVEGARALVVGGDDSGLVRLRAPPFHGARLLVLQARPGCLCATSRVAYASAAPSWPLWSSYAKRWASLACSGCRRSRNCRSSPRRR